MTHLMELLKAHQSRDAEASRLQQALQCQEEADAATDFCRSTMDERNAFVVGEDILSVLERQTLD